MSTFSRTPDIMVLEGLFSCGQDDDAREIAIETKLHDDYNVESRNTPVLECTFEISPHALYLAVERRQWDVALELLQDVPEEILPPKQPRLSWFVSQLIDLSADELDLEMCKQNSILSFGSFLPQAEDRIEDGQKIEAANSSPAYDQTNEDCDNMEKNKVAQMASKQGFDRNEVLARTWIVSKDEDGKVIWRILPIHAAVIFGAPIDVFKRLLEVYPSGAKLKDTQGNTPLHLCYSEGINVDIAELIRKHFPECDGIKNNQGLVPSDNLGASAAVQKVKEDQNNKIAEIEHERGNQIARKEIEIAVLKESYESRLAALQEAHKSESGAFEEKLKKLMKEHESAIAIVQCQKDKEIERLGLEKALLEARNELGKLKEESLKEKIKTLNEKKIETPYVPQVPRTRKTTKSKSFFKKMGSLKKSSASNASPEFSIISTRSIVSRKEGSIFSDAQHDSFSESNEGNTKSKFATAE